MTLRFGTDGVRGVANVELTPELVLALGRAAPRVLPGRRWLVGRDTRRSGPLLQAALSAGLAAEGASVVDLGVVPTPLVAYLSEQDGLPAAMISASHNPFGDNGVKFFAPGGQKLPDGIEARLESELATIVAGVGGAGASRDVPGALHVGAPTAESLAGPPSGNFVGELSHDGEGADRYLEHLTVDALDGRRLDGLRVVVDCANGAASNLAPEVLRSLGCEVTVLHARPDGSNINAGCGSTHPADLQRTVPQRGAQVGFAFAGDADRVVAVAEEGHLVDGDQLIALCALDRRERGLLADDTVVVTVMSNLGFRLGMERHGVTVIETDVGDRNVLAALDRGGWSLGGEQSGHIIFRDLATTGDGLLTALQVLDTMARTGRSLADLASSAMARLPQVLLNVRLEHRHAGLLAAVAPDVAAAQEALGQDGRVLVRPSGTEPVVRVMVEAPTREQAVAIADGLAAAVARASADDLGLQTPSSP
jgi:phosphoglucosamine mutase